MKCLLITGPILINKPLSPFRKLQAMMIYKNISIWYAVKKIQGLLFLLFLVSALSAQNMNPREIIPLDSAWKFWLGDDPSARQPGFDDSKWRVVDVPHD